MKDTQSKFPQKSRIVKIPKQNLVCDDFDKMGENDITMLNYEFNEGYNGMVTIVPFKFCKPFAFRIEEAAEFHANYGRLVTEKFLRYVVDKYYNKKHFINFKLKIVRPPA